MFLETHNCTIFKNINNYSLLGFALLNSELRSSCGQYYHLPPLPINFLPLGKPHLRCSLKGWIESLSLWLCSLPPLCSLAFIFLILWDIVKNTKKREEKPKCYISSKPSNHMSSISSALLAFYLIFEITLIIWTWMKFD